MAKNEKLKKITKLLDRLNEKDLDELTNDVYNRLIASGAQPSLSREFDRMTMTACVHCGSVAFIKNGKDRKGNSRYLCKDCGKSFTALTNTALNGTHKSASVWKEYVKNLLDGLPLEECAKRCNISVRTAFLWRHKILSSLNEQTSEHQYSGLLEMDEMFVRISYKGNHKNSKTFVMPRDPHKRGGDGHEQSIKSKAAVLCVVERGKGFYASIPCRGMINNPVLKSVFDGKLSDESVVMTDGLRAYKNYFDTTHAQHIVLPGTKKGTRQFKVIGPYHINNVNAMHHRFRDFLRKFNGVSTKFLKNYLALFLWHENHRNTDKNALMCDAISATGSYTSTHQFEEWARTPELAPPPETAA